MKNSYLSSVDILKNRNRPNSADYIDSIFNDFIELSGDRLFGDDPSIIGGVALLNRFPVTVIGQLRGKTVEEQIKYNYSMTHPEGFRKSLRLMKQAEKFGRPIICFIDTIGAYPGKQAEERGQASAIANNMMEMMFLKVPIISVLIGYGSSGGALALCVADRIAILENSVLSVISPKACAEILWKDTRRENDAVAILKMSSGDLLDQGIVDYVIAEPVGGAQADLPEAVSAIKDYLVREIHVLTKQPISKLLKKRRQKYKSVGEIGKRSKVMQSKPGVRNTSFH